MEILVETKNKQSQEGQIRSVVNRKVKRICGYACIKHSNNYLLVIVQYGIEVPTLLDLIFWKVGRGTINYELLLLFG